MRFLIILLMPALIIAAEFTAKEVTVYDGFAKVGKTGKVQIKKGKHRLVIDKQPASLVPASLRIRFAHNRVKVVSISSSRENSGKSSDIYEERIAELREKIRETKNAIRHLDSQSRSLSSLETDKAVKNRTASPLLLREFINMAGSLLEDNEQKKFRLMDALEKYREELEIARLSTRLFLSEKKHTRIEIEYISPEEADTTVNLSYLAAGANWYPGYDLNISPENNEISYYALVKNNTGEDWPGVKARLSSASPVHSFITPSLPVWKISAERKEVYRPSAGKKREYKKMEKADMPMEEDSLLDESPVRTAAEKSKSARPPQAEKLQGIYSNIYRQQQEMKDSRYDNVIEHGQNALIQLNEINPAYEKYITPGRALVQEYMKQAYLQKANREISGRLIAPKKTSTGRIFVYDISNPVNISSDNSFNRMFIEKTSFRSENRYEASPLSSPGVFLVIKSEAPGSNWLSGPVDIYMNNNFTGTSSLKNVLKGSKFKIYAGNDRDIEVFRTVDKFIQNRGLLGGRVSESYQITLHIRNNKQSAADLSVFDRIPVTEDKNIEIREAGFSAEPEKKPGGILRFVLKLGSGESRKITFKYNISYPENRKVSGL